MTTAYETLPALLAALHERHPALKAESRELFAGDVIAALIEERFDVALAPRAPLPEGLVAQAIRRERLVALVGEHHPLAARGTIALVDLRDERFELWPRGMAPGFHDAIVAACRGAGFEPVLDEAASGSTVWGHVAHGDGVALSVASIAAQLARGIALLELEHPAPSLTIDAVWRSGTDLPAVERFGAVAAAVRDENGWLHDQPTGPSDESHV